MLLREVQAGAEVYVLATVNTIQGREHYPPETHSCCLRLPDGQAIQTNVGNLVMRGAAPVEEATVSSILEEKQGEHDTVIASLKADLEEAGAKIEELKKEAKELAARALQAVKVATEAVMERDSLKAKAKGKKD